MKELEPSVLLELLQCTNLALVPRTGSSTEERLMGGEYKSSSTLGNEEEVKRFRESQKGDRSWQRTGGCVRKHQMEELGHLEKLVLNG